MTARATIVAIAAIAGLLTQVARADTVVNVQGTIVERTTKAPVAGAVVSIGAELVASDDSGMFSVALAPGRYTLAITGPGITPVTREIDVRTDASITIAVDAAPGETIEVTGLAPTTIGQNKIDAATARIVPGGGDAAKIIQSMPAVARPPAGSTEIVVWGAAPQDTRVFVDGVPVPALYHLGGYRSAVGSDLIGDLQLTPAAFGVDRGGAIGGVIDIGMADPASVPSWRVQADVLDASASGRTTIAGVTIAAAVRQSWLDHAIAVVEDPAKLAPNAPLPRWTDAQLVARAHVADRTVVTGWILASLDTLDQRLASDDPATQTDDTIDQRSIRGQVTIRRDHDAGYESATLWMGRDRSSNDLQVGLIAADLAARDWVGGARGIQQQRLSDALTLTLGTDLDGQSTEISRLGSLTIPAREGDPHIFGQPPGDDVNADAWHTTTIDAAGHAAVDLRSGPITALVGLRVDAWLLTASRLTPRVGSTPGIGFQDITFTPDPRGSVQVRLSDDAVVRADAGRYHQAREASDTSAVFGTPGLGVEEAWHVTAGGQWRHAPFAVEAAVYARWLDDLVARDLAVTPLFAQALTQGGTGRVLGLEVTARVVGWRGLSGWLSYNLSSSRRQDADSQPERYFDHDQTHGLIAVAGWECGPWSLGGRVRFATGEPRTDVIGSLFDSRSGRYQPIRGAHNGIRLPAYFAADARAERRFPVGGARGAVYVEIQNLTDRANAEEIIYSADFSQKGYLTSLPLLAIAGVRIEQ
ncbi:MAG TPA: TonB-dependent receptor [Kofleriaceae bacterium]|nr:TonB-dependent receptor [Kofleriaceae bacterium]